MIIKIITSKYLFFIFLSFVFNIILATHVAKTSYNEKNKLQVREIIQCGIIETVGIILGAKIIDIIMNYDVYLNYINNNMFFNILTSGYTFIFGAFGGFISILVYSFISKKDLKMLCNIFIPNLLIIYSVSKIGCYLNGCCGGITIMNYTVPIQLIESITYFAIYLFILLRKNSAYSKIYLSCILFGFFRFVLEFLRVSNSYMWLSISQVLSIFIFIVGIVICHLERTNRILEI